MKPLTPVIALVIALVAAGPAAGQDQRLAQRLPSDLAAQIQALVDSTAAAGLPTEPLIDLALEGAAKRASRELIIKAVSRMRRNLIESRQRLGESASDSELVTAAHALRQGLPAEQLSYLREARPEASLQVPLTTMLELVARGVSTAVAQELIGQLAGAGSDDDFRAFLSQVDEAIDGGQEPEPASLQAGRRMLERLRRD